MLEPDLIDYLVVHELAHLTEIRNHSSRLLGSTSRPFTYPTRKNAAGVSEQPGPSLPI